MAKGGGMCGAGGMRGRGVYMAGEMVTAADGTHPTGMHSCYYAVIDLFQNIYPTDKFKQQKCRPVSFLK